MRRRITVIDAHPDPDRARFGHALAVAYVHAAQDAGHEVRQIALSQLDFPLLRSKDEHESGMLPGVLEPAQAAIAWAEHLVFIFPLWLGGAPALMKGFLEQVLRPGFAYNVSEQGKVDKLLAGKSARIIVTMGMPAFFYRWYFGAHALKSLKRSILGFCGIGPIKTTLIGLIEGISDAKRKQWLADVAALGRDGR